MVMWLRMSGVDFTSIVATSAVITAVIAFSMQETLGNILGAWPLQLDHSIRIGDWVKVDDLSGRVVEIRWRYTAIETRNRETVVVPNSFLMKNRFTVIGSRNDKEPRWRRWVWFNVSTDAGVGRVIEVLERSVRDASIAHVAVEPAPSATLMEALPNGGRFALRYWLTDPQCDDPLTAPCASHRLAALTRAGISLVLPVEERMLIRRTPRILCGASASRRGASACCAMSTCSRPCRTANGVPCTPPYSCPIRERDVMTRHCAVAHWLYLIVAGQCDVVVDKADGERKLVATLSDGSIFGEMGMMTGEPAPRHRHRRHRCRMLPAGQGRIPRHPRGAAGPAQEISRVLVDRNVALVKTGGSDPGNRQHAQVGLINKIRAFFDLGNRWCAVRTPYPTVAGCAPRTKDPLLDPPFLIVLFDRISEKTQHRRRRRKSAARLRTRRWRIRTCPTIARPPARVALVIASRCAGFQPRPSSFPFAAPLRVTVSDDRVNARKGIGIQFLEISSAFMLSSNCVSLVAP